VGSELVYGSPVGSMLGIGIVVVLDDEDDCDGKGADILITVADVLGATAGKIEKLWLTGQRYIGVEVSIN